MQWLRISKQQIDACLVQFFPFLKGVRVTGSKQIRDSPLSSCAEHGNVMLLRAPWNGVFLDELEIFPDGAHDDIVDAAAGAFSKLTEHVPVR